MDNCEGASRERERKSRREGNRSWFISCNGSSHVLCLSSPSSTCKKTNSFFLPKYGLHFLSFQLDLLPFPLPCPSFFFGSTFFRLIISSIAWKLFFHPLCYFLWKETEFYLPLLCFFSFGFLHHPRRRILPFSSLSLPPLPVRFFGSASTLLLLPSQSLPVSWFTSVVSAETHKLYFPLFPPPFLSPSLSFSYANFSSLFLFSLCIPFFISFPSSHSSHWNHTSERHENEWMLSWVENFRTKMKEREKRNELKSSAIPSFHSISFHLILFLSFSLSLCLFFLLPIQGASVKKEDNEKSELKMTRDGNIECERRERGRRFAFGEWKYPVWMKP